VNGLQGRANGLPGATCHMLHGICFICIYGAAQLVVAALTQYSSPLLTLPSDPIFMLALGWRPSCKGLLMLTVLIVILLDGLGLE